MQSTVTLVGNVASDVTLRQTASGPVAGFRLAASNGYVDRRTRQWVERTTWLSVSAWRALGEHVAGSLHKGQPVVVVGRLRQREFEKDGHMVTVIDVDADLVGHDLNRGIAQFARSPRGPQTADLARESVIVTELSGDGDTRSTDVTDGTGWAVPGLSVVADDGVPGPAEDPAA